MRQLRVFVVEDNAVVLENLCAALVEVAFVEIAGTADCEQDALAWLGEETNACDVVLVDMYLRAGSGLGVLKGVVDLPNRPTRIAVVSNYATDEMRRRCTALGAHRVFDKSREIDELLSWLIRVSRESDVGRG